MGLHGKSKPLKALEIKFHCAERGNTPDALKHEQVFTRNKPGSKQVYQATLLSTEI